MKLVIRFCALILISLAHVSFAGDVYFRSDHGIQLGKAPEKFDAPLWRAQLASGHSTPIISNGRLFLTSFDASSNSLVTLALDEKSGKVLWKQVAPASRIESVHRVGSPASGTPACDGKRLYIFFGSYGLLCYDLDGKLMWQHSLPPFQDEYGAASSPVLVDDKLVLAQDHDINSFVMALDCVTGKQLWNTDRPDAVRSYSTPAVWERNGKKELLVAGALQLISYDPANGKKLWWKNGLARIVIPTAVPSGNMIYMASWAPGGDAGQRLALDSWETALQKWDANKDGLLTKAEINNSEVLDRFFRMDLDQNGTLDHQEWDRHANVFRRAQNAILAVKPSGDGELSDGDVVWKYQRGVPYVATPVAHQGSIWMVKDGGIVTRLEARTGRAISEERLPGIGNYFASPVACGDKVYFASEQGVLSVVSTGSEWKVLAKHDFHESINATPAIHDGRLFVRTEKALYCFD